MEVPLPWERVLWSCRSWSAGIEQYALTDFRLVRLDGARSVEIALYDLRDVRATRTPVDRILGTTTLAVSGRRGQEIVLRHIRRGLQLRAILDILIADPTESIDAEAIRAALNWEPRDGRNRVRDRVLVFGAVVTTIFSVAIGVHGRPTDVIYPEHDAVYPGGRKRDHESVVRFMETAVMPWARRALAPVVGGADRVSCQTCHGDDAGERGWAMPAVAALPQPDVVDRGWERYSVSMSAQMRNAIYGYLAESDNQSTAAYMREVVMPGMARLLGRPAYDFTKTYEYNRTHFSFGCYHCHQVR
jgi:hypothetical protein